MEMVLVFLAGVILTLALVWTSKHFVGFHAQRPEDYDCAAKSFDLRRHLDGPLICEGVIFGATGRVSSRFVAEMQGSWNGDSGTLAEHFVYDSGEAQDREWRLTVGANGLIRAEADDVVGTGRGQQAGSGVCLNYDIRLPASSGGFILSAVDWMYLVENGTVVKRSQFRKFGIKVAELVATIRPVEAIKSGKRRVA